MLAEYHRIVVMFIPWLVDNVDSSDPEREGSLKKGSCQPNLVDTKIPENQAWIIYRERLNGGTVPPDKTHPRGTVPPAKTHPGGTVPLDKTHPRGTVPADKTHPGGTIPLTKGNPEGLSFSLKSLRAIH